MKNITLLLISIFTLTACEPAINCLPNCGGKRIRFIESGGKFNRITYDTENRQLEYIQARDSISRFTYDTDLAESIQNGLAVQYITDDTIVPGLTLITKSINGASGMEISYEYDAAGHLVKAIQTQPGNIVKKLLTITYTWVNGNMIKLESATGASQPQIINYTYETTVFNSISNEFKGLHMSGKTSVNALKSTNSNNVITNFTHETNGCGCITKTTSSTNGTNAEQKFIYELVD